MSVFRNYKNVCLAVNKVPDETKDYHTIWRHLLVATTPFNITECILKNVFSISDEGANINKCLRIYNKKSMHFNLN